jgi:hypothetical protein
MEAAHKPCRQIAKPKRKSMILPVAATIIEVEIWFQVSWFKSVGDIPPHDSLWFVGEGTVEASR